LDECSLLTLGQITDPFPLENWAELAHNGSRYAQSFLGPRPSPPMLSAQQSTYGHRCNIGVLKRFSERQSSGSQIALQVGPRKPNSVRLR